MYGVTYRVCVVLRANVLQMARRSLTRDELMQAVALVDAGHSARQVGRQLGRHHSVIARAVEKWNNENEGRYRDEILAVHVQAELEQLDDLILMQDNARPHVANVCRRWLDEHEVPVMDWPAMSPDQNPIEHCWDWLKRRVRKWQPRPGNMLELYNVAVEVWESMPQEYVDALIMSCRNRCAEVIRARGGNTRY
ncbi:hypothetical protein FOCC_FOCC012464 [Frankliniella occidentalis]|nr:hypothetical protein FOCC_FOCC012464 [Frankliniella occidentalis]